MFDQIVACAGSDALITDPISDLRRFLTDHLDGLRSAACLLAGGRGARLVGEILDRFGRESQPSRKTWEVLRDLLGILTLENVHDDTRPEAALFAQIDPASPVVEEICLLCDQFRDAIEAAIGDDPKALALVAAA